MEFLNVQNSPPAFITFRYSSKEHRRLDITGLKAFLVKFLDESPVLKYDSELDKEIYIFRKLLYKMNFPFRRHRHFQMSKRLKKLLERCFDRERGQLKKTSTVVREFVTGIQLDKKDILYCPSGEYFQYALVNLRSLATLLADITKFCVELFSRTMHMLDMGHFVQTHCLLIGVAAKFRSDCCGRLDLLQQFFANFKATEYLKRGLELNRVDSFSSDTSVYHRIFDDLPDVTAVLDDDKRVRSENLSGLARKRTVDYFEELFNVRLPEQLEKRQTMGGRVKKKRLGLDFGHALSSTSAQPASVQDYDLGVPVKVSADTGEITALTPLEECIQKLDDANTLEKLRQFTVQLEKAKGLGKSGLIAVRILRKEIQRIDENEERTFVFKRIQRGIKNLLLKG